MLIPPPLPTEDRLRCHHADFGPVRLYYRTRPFESLGGDVARLLWADFDTVAAASAFAAEQTGHADFWEPRLTDREGRWLTWGEELSDLMAKHGRAAVETRPHLAA